MNKIKLLMAAVLTFVMAAFTVSCEEPAPENVAVTGVEITPEKDTLLVGDSLVFAVEVLPTDATNKEYQLFSNNPELVTIEGDKITAQKAGKVTITVTTKDGAKMDTAEILIEEKEEEGPNQPTPPVDQDPLEFVVEFKVFTDDFIVRIIPSIEDARYWLWCVEASELDAVEESKRGEYLLAKDKELIEDVLIPAWLEEFGTEGTVEDVLSVFSYVGGQDRSIKNLMFEVPLKPATKYYVYMYGVELDGTPTTEVFTFDQTTKSETSSDDTYDIIFTMTEAKYKDLNGDGKNFYLILKSGSDEASLYLNPATAGQLAGEYTVTDGSMGASSNMYYNDGKSPIMVQFVEGETVITKEGETYTVVATGSLENEKMVKVTYTGAIALVENGGGNEGGGNEGGGDTGGDNGGNGGNEDGGEDSGEDGGNTGGDNGGNEGGGDTGGNEGGGDTGGNNGEDNTGSGNEDELNVVELKFTSAEYYNDGMYRTIYLYSGTALGTLVIQPENMSNWSGTYDDNQGNISVLTTTFSYPGQVEAYVSKDIVVKIKQDGDIYIINGSCTMEDYNGLALEKLKFSFNGPIPEVQD